MGPLPRARLVLFLPFIPGQNQPPHLNAGSVCQIELFIELFYVRYLGVEHMGYLDT